MPEDREKKNAVDVETRARNASRWIVSEEGRQAIREAMERADRSAAEFLKACRVDTKTLDDPITI